MGDGEVADDGIERRVIEGKGVRIRLPEVDIRMEPSCEATIASACLLSVW